MNKAQRVAVLVGVVVVLFALGRMLTPFSTRVVLNPQAVRQRSRVQPCGLAVSEAVKKPSVRSDQITLTSAGEAQKQKAQAEQDRAIRANASSGSRNSFNGSGNPLGGLTYEGTAPTVKVPEVGPDTTYDHTTLTTFSLSPCESAARRRVTSAGVLVGLAVVGLLAGLVLLRDDRERTGPEVEVR